MNSSEMVDSSFVGDGNFLVDGEPIFLVAGAIDYFRCPPELWRDRLLKAKRGGLNCIASYIAWNYHEAEEGRFDFTGKRDLGRFIDLCGELGLYFYPRVGPFICGEWDGGGHPAWLIAKDDIQFRTNNEATLKYIRKWFEQLIPVLVPRQTTRGGPVILVQEENEYHYSDRPGGKDYQSTLISWLRELGIEVPITDCNISDTRLKGSLRTINDVRMDVVKQFQEEYPELPVMISEFWIGFIESWGLPPVTASPEKLHRQAMGLLSTRAMYNYFMYHGGTNFGFRASSSWKRDDAFVTTSYFPYGPLAEGGAFNDTYYTAKAADQLVTNFQDFFCRSKPADCPVQAEGAIQVSALRSPQGTMVFVLPGEGSDEKPGQLVLPSGEHLELADAADRSMMVPYEFEAVSGYRIDWANATLAGVAGSNEQPVLVFQGKSGSKGQASINGQVIKFDFGDNEPVVKEAGTVCIVGLSHERAGRTWFADGRLIIGPAYVGEADGKNHECWFHGGETRTDMFESDGSHRHEVINVPTTPDKKMPLPKWRSMVLSEISGGGDGWQSIAEPESLEKLGVLEGYAWYRASYHSKQARSATLMFTYAADRFHVFINGKAYGVWGRGDNATRDPLPIELAAGENDFVFLCDNMGHSSEGHGKESKGILGPVVLDAKPRELGMPRRFVPDKPPCENYEFKTYRDFYDNCSLTGFSWAVEQAPSERLLLTLRDVPQYAWIRVNGRLVGEHGGDFSLINGFSFKEFLLTDIDSEGPIDIEVILSGAELEKPEQHVCLFAYPEQPGLTEWRFKPWQRPTKEGTPLPGEPCWWECEFPHPDIPGPLFLHPMGLSKCHVWLNDRAVGRYWNIGPQKILYLPEPWWQPQNRMAVFEEEGRCPDRIFLARDERAPSFMKPL